MFLPQLGICKNGRTNGGGRPPPLSSQSQLNTILRELRPLVMAQKESKLKSPSWQNDRWWRADAKTRGTEKKRDRDGTAESYLPRRTPLWESWCCCCCSCLCFEPNNGRKCKSGGPMSSPLEENISFRENNYVRYAYTRSRILDRTLSSFPLFRNLTWLRKILPIAIVVFSLTTEITL